jgi:hypothetical protein
VKPDVQEVLDLAPSVRYVAIYRNGELKSAQRPGISAASAGESDRYEELLVNPTLITLCRQRGNIDCGGLEYVVIRYGSFFELVYPVSDGHVSVGIDAASNPLEVVSRLSGLLGVR